MKKLAAFAAVLALASCDDVNVHILSGQLYQPQADCLEPSSGIDVVNGGSTGDNCDPQCLSIGEGDATAIYVTTMCPPYPRRLRGGGRGRDRGARRPLHGRFRRVRLERLELPGEPGRRWRRRGERGGQRRRGRGSSAGRSAGGLAPRGR